VVEKSKIMNVMGALVELEKVIPGAGAALQEIYFPGGMEYSGRTLRYNWEKKFWKLAFSTLKDRRRTITDLMKGNDMKQERGQEV